MCTPSAGWPWRSDSSPTVVTRRSRARAWPPGCPASTRPWSRDISTPIARASWPRSSPRLRPRLREAVVGVLAPHLGVETPVQLRRRCRRTLARISPDLLRQRAKRAREECGLRRWVDEPGVDRWEGTFPSEQAAEGWATVDALARRYVAEGLCQRVEQARARALMDLIRQQATIDVQLVVTVPAGVCTGEAVGTAAQTSAASRPFGLGRASERGHRGTASYVGHVHRHVLRRGLRGRARTRAVHRLSEVGADHARGRCGLWRPRWRPHRGRRPVPR